MMKPILTLAVATLAAISGTASATVRHEAYSFDASGRKTYYSYDGEVKTVMEAPSAKLSAPGKAKKELATFGEPKLLDIELVYDEKEYELRRLGGGERSYGAFAYYGPEKKLGIQEIPSGIASLMCFWYKMDDQTREEYIYVAAKDISGLENGDKVVFDINDCIHRVEYAPVDEDGNEFDMITMKQGEVYKPGKYSPLSYTIMFANKTDGVVYTFQSNYIKYIKISTGEEVYQRPRYIYWNDCGPEFMMGHYMIAGLSEKPEFTIVEMPVYQGTDSKEASERVLSNDPAGFRVYEQKWTRSPYSVSNYTQLCYGSNLYVDFQGTTSAGIGMAGVVGCGDEADVESRLRVCANSSDMPGSEFMSMLLVDAMPETDRDMESGISSWRWKPGKNGREYAPINSTGCQGMNVGYYSSQWMENYYFVEGNVNDWLLPKALPNTNLLYEDSKMLGRLGNNTPIISIMPGLWLPLGSDMTLFNYGLVGRYGEGNIAAMEFIEQTGTDDYDEDGFRKEFFSYENVLIDGEVDGRVDVEMSIKQGDEDDDFFPPMLTHLLTRNTEGYWTDRFENASEGVVEFYAGDFYHNFDWSLAEYGFYEYKCRPLTEDRVKVEYAPYGTDNFAELTVKEVPEKYFYPAYGNYFTVSLKDVDADSPNGWYDMRISLEDETGNKHVQTISPVFKLGEISGVEEIAAGAQLKTPVYYDLMGQKVKNPTNGVFIEYDGKRARKVRR